MKLIRLRWLSILVLDFICSSESIVKVDLRLLLDWKLVLQLVSFDDVAFIITLKTDNFVKVEKIIMCQKISKTIGSTLTVSVTTQTWQWWHLMIWLKQMTFWWKSKTTFLILKEFNLLWLEWLQNLEQQELNGTFISLVKKSATQFHSVKVFLTLLQMQTVLQSKLLAELLLIEISHAF